MNIYNRSLCHVFGDYCRSSTYKYKIGRILLEQFFKEKVRVNHSLICSKKRKYFISSNCLYKAVYRLRDINSYTLYTLLTLRILTSAKKNLNAHIMQRFDGV